MMNDKILILVSDYFWNILTRLGMESANMVLEAGQEKEKTGTTEPSRYFKTVMQLGLAGLVKDNKNRSLRLHAFSSLRKRGLWFSFSFGLRVVQHIL